MKITRTKQSIFSARNILSLDKIYHGGSHVITKPDLRRMGDTKDFGWGFYCTNIKEQAERWANRKGGIVNVYTWKPSVLNTLNCLEFKDIETEEGLEAWLDFISENRGEDSGSQIHDFDIAAGPMGDDKLWIPIAAWSRKPTEENRQKVRNAAKFNYPTQQICFCTQRAINALEYYDSYEVK